MKVFDVDPEKQESQRLTPAIGSQEWAEVEHDFESGIAAFQPGQKTHLHTHSNDQLIYVIDGKGIIGTETEQYLATPGKVFVTPKNQCVGTLILAPPAVHRGVVFSVLIDTYFFIGYTCARC